MPHWSLHASRRTRALAALAGAAAVAAVTLTALPARAADGPGAITGHFTDGAAPIADAWVSLVDTDYVYVTGGSTGPDGGFSLPAVPAGSYKLSFSMGGNFTQWVAQKRTFAEADIVTVAPGQTTTIEESVRPHGGLTGRVTNADGTPAASVHVNVGAFDGDTGGNTQTDADGRYTIPYLDAVDYRVGFYRDYNSPVQYANNATSYMDATPIPVSIGAPTTLDQTLLTASSITGVVTAGGSPVAGVFVYVNGADYVSGGSGYTGEDGRYEVSVWPGSYMIQFNRPDGLSEYAPRKLDWFSAGQYQVTLDAPTVVDEELVATGTITGRLTTADGAAVPYAGIHAHNGSVDRFANTDFDGRYTFVAFPGSYTLEFDTSHGKQWATGRSSGALADPITVEAGVTVVANEVLNPYGSIEVTAVDRQTRAALMSFCANVETIFSGCTDTGTLTVPEVLPGRHVVSAYPPDSAPEEFVSDSVVAEVTSRAATAVQMPVTPGGSVSTVITDAATGAPVAGACLDLARADRPMIGGVIGGQSCSDASGKVRVPVVPPGSYYAFVSVQDGVHGDQWVGRQGGVGMAKKADLIKVKAGESVTLKPVRLDPAGSISGVVTDEASGQPLRSGFVGLNPYNTGAGGPTRFDTPIDHQGRYTMSGLGPYAWSLYFSDFDSYAGEWSGDTANRDKALGIRVRAGQTTRYDTALGAGTVVTGRVFGPSGAEADGARIVFVSTAGDELAVGATYAGLRQYVVRVKGPVRLKVSYWASFGAQEYDGWVGGTSFADASTLSIPRGGEVTYDVTATTLSP